MNAAIRTLGYWLMPMALVWLAVRAQEKPADYPQRPLRIILAVAPGGVLIARATAQMLSDRWGHNAVVDSRPGGAGVVAVELLARASPDGHTMMHMHRRWNDADQGHKSVLPSIHSKRSIRLSARAPSPT